MQSIRFPFLDILRIYADVHTQLCTHPALRVSNLDLDIVPMHVYLSHLYCRLLYMALQHKISVKACSVES